MEGVTKKTVASAMLRVRAWWPEQEDGQSRRAEKTTLATMQRRSARRTTLVTRRRRGVGEANGTARTVLVTVGI